MPVRLDVWAPIPEQVDVVIRDPKTGESETVPMEAVGDGWWRLPETQRPLARTGLDYGYRLDGSEQIYPAPRSRRQPYGVHGMSRTIDASVFPWTDQSWKGRQLAGGVIYELHVGTFTREGTLDAAIERLDELVALGVDFVELMPVAAFNGDTGWGYDGVLWFAVHEPYGGPDAYLRFVDACHARGLAVIQDVVYNHLGPSGNYLPAFGPYLDASNQSPWGSAINLSNAESDQVRRYILDNVTMWLQEYHVDGLRLDAVHALVDNRAIHLLEEIAIEVGALSTFLGRPLSLIAESDQNDPRMITPREAGGFGLTAQWSDDFHHALLANLTGDDSGYYADFASLDALGKVIESGFFHDGTKSSFRGRRHGRRLDTPTVPAYRLVVCSDNHDQIGNRADGARLGQSETPQQLQLAAMLVLLSAYTPMIFMGEEWGASTPFCFFSSHPEPDLAEAVTAGRVEEFAAMNWDPAAIADPQDPATFERSKLDWDEASREPHRTILHTYRELIALRHTYPDFTDPRFEWVGARFDPGEQWFVMERGELMSVAVNFADHPTHVPFDEAIVVLFRTGEVALHDGDLVLGPHAGAVVSLADPGRAPGAPS